MKWTKPTINSMPPNGYYFWRWKINKNGLDPQQTYSGDFRYFREEELSGWALRHDAEYLDETPSKPIDAGRGEGWKLQQALRELLKEYKANIKGADFDAITVNAAEEALAASPVAEKETEGWGDEDMCIAYNSGTVDQALGKVEKSAKWLTSYRAKTNKKPTEIIGEGKGRVVTLPIVNNVGVVYRIVNEETGEEKEYHWVEIINNKTK